MPAVTDARQQPLGPVGPRPGGSAVFVLTAAALGAGRILVGGYSFGAGDQACWVPLVRGFAEGRYLNDYTLQNPPRLSFFVPLVGSLARIVPIETVFFAGYVLASISAAVALYLLAERMLASRPAAILAVVMLQTGKFIAAGTSTWEQSLVPSTAAMPLALFAWWMLLKSRPAWAGFLMGLAFAIHPLAGLYASAIAVAAIIVGEPETWPPLWRFCAGMLAPCAATVLYALGSRTPILSAPPEWYHAMLLRNLYHIAPASYVLLACALAWAVAAAAYVGVAGGKSRLLLGATGVTALVFTYSAGALIAGHAADFEFREMALLKPPLLAILQLPRISGYFGILIFVATAGVLWSAMQKGLVARLSAAGAAVAFSFSHYAVGMSFLAAALLSQGRSGRMRATGVALALAAVSAAAVYHKTLVVLISAVVVTGVVAALAARNTRFSAASAALLAALALVGLVPAGWAGRAALRTFGPAASADSLRYVRPVEIYAGGNEAMLEAAGWIARNAAPDEVTIIPPWWESFRVLAQRPVYGTYKDGTLIVFNASLAGPWLDRMAALRVPLAFHGGPIMRDADRPMYSMLREDDIALAAKRHPARYAVRLSADLPTFREAFRGAHCSIYEIPARQEEQ
jgi:hypothetical protein